MLAFILVVYELVPYLRLPLNSAIVQNTSEEPVRRDGEETDCYVVALVLLEAGFDIWPSLCADQQ